MRALGLWLACGFALSACDAKKQAGGNGEEPQASPNASILPAPITSAHATARKPDAGRGGIPADSAGRLLIPDAAPPERVPLVADRALPEDTITTREGPGVTLEARLRWFDVPAPLVAPEVSSDALAEARARVEPRLTVDLAPVGRMRLLFASPAFPVPRGAELRSAVEHYGHALVWPDGHAYRVVVPGTLRALLAERRVDAIPLSAGTHERRGRGAVLGLATERVAVKSDAGTLLLEQADVTGIGESGGLLCRALLELIAVEPTSTVCSSRTPLRAEMTSSRGGRLAFEVTSITRRQDLLHGLLLVPPAGTMVKLGELPPQASGVLLSREEIARFRAKPMPGESAADAPGEGLLAVNLTDKLRYILVDGVPVAWVKPRSEQYIIGPMPGRYVVSWRDFFGADVGAPKTLQLPARSVVGAATDGGP